MRKASQIATNTENSACENHQSMDRAMHLIGDMWTLAIIHNLLTGSKRFGELLDALGKVSPKTISQRLKMLEERGFVDRHAFAEIPPRVEYNLTEKGQAFVNVIEAIRDFGDRYLSDETPTDTSICESSPLYG
jgi:DNA-binding HxlR family transcriptional regulator